MNKTVKSGYIMVFTLIIISLSTMLITNLSYKVRSHIHYTKTATIQEKAKLLALSGLEIAKSQLSFEQEKERNKEKKEHKNSTIENIKLFIKKIVPSLNSWQNFKLSKKSDGINGQIQLCIMSEEGKININELFSIKDKKFVWINQNAKKIVQYICSEIEKYTKKEKLFNDIESYLKKRKNKLYDVTQLLSIKNMNYFNNNVFYEPSNKNESKKTPIYLTDIFTLWSKNKEINPWLLSESTKKIAGITTNKKNNKKLKKIEKTIKNLKVPFTWPRDWDTMLSPLYGKKFDQLPKEVKSIIGKSFESTVFSVLSYGTVENITQKVFIIIERIKNSKNNNRFFEFKIKKLYWL